MQPDFECQWRRRFAERGSRLDDDAGIAGWTPSGLRTRVRQFRLHWEAEEDRPAGYWLDVGCGSGVYSRLLQRAGHRVAGLDYSVPSLGKAGQRSPAGIAWVAADARRLPVRDGVVDGALCFGVMQALAGPEAALAELRRVVRPGGEVWVDALNARCGPTAIAEWRRRWAGRPPHLRYDTPSAFRAAARRAGLEPVAWHWMPILPSRLQRFQGLLESPACRWLLQAVPPLGALLSHSFILRARRSADSAAPRARQ